MINHELNMKSCVGVCVCVGVCAYLYRILSITLELYYAWSLEAAAASQPHSHCDHRLEHEE